MSVGLPVRSACTEKGRQKHAEHFHMFISMTKCMWESINTSRPPRKRRTRAGCSGWRRGHVVQGSLLPANINDPVGPKRNILARRN